MDAKKKSTLTYSLAIVGTVLVWLPVLAPVIFSAVRLARGGSFMLDYLMPAELLPLVLLGSGLLLWAALRVRSQHKWVAWSLTIGVVALAAALGLAQVTGLASETTDVRDWRFTLVMSFLVLFDLSVVAIGVGGVRLLKDLFCKHG